MKFTFAPEASPLEGFTIKRGIHRGGFGEVYYALSDAGKEVALKLLQNNTDVELRGVRHCLNLKHPNLVSIFDIRRDGDGDHWIIMEYMAGATLDAVLAKSSGGLELDELQLWIDGITAGLAFLHDRGIVHRDLKPANVYEDQRIVKIGDVGLSKFISQSRRGAQTQSVGTVYYMAPEIARGSYGREVDIYALGVMLYEMLTGDVPFDGETTGEILMKHLSDHPDLERLPRPFRAVVARAMEKDPRKRTATIEQFADEFHAALDVLRGHDTEPARTVHREPASDSPSVEVVTAGVVKEAVGDQECDRLRPPQDATTPRGKTDWNTDESRSRASTEHTPHRQQPTVRPTGRTAGPMASFGAIVGVALLFYMLVGLRPGDDLNWLTIVLLLGCGMAWGVKVIFDTVHPHVPAPHRHPVHSRRGQRRWRRGEVLTPETFRFVSWYQRLTELSGSLAVASVMTAVLTACLHLVTDFLPTREAVGVFGFTTMAAAWVILSVVKFQEGASLDRNTRRLSMLAAGLVVGALASLMDGYLLLEFSPESTRVLGLFQTVGRHQLVEAGQPTLAGYLVFFGGLFGLRRWWWLADAFRSTRFQIRSTLLTLVLAFLWTCVFAFPQGWGVLWAVAMSCVVQLSAAWTPPASRVVELPEAAVA